MLANAITVSRLLLTFVVILLFGHHPSLDLALIGMIAFVIVLDGVDGWVARKCNEVSETGALLDTLADRMIENTFFIYFSVRGLIPIWMPIVVMCRGVGTDALQQLWGYPTGGWRFALTRSRWSRFVSGMSKLLAFVSLASAMVFENTTLETVSFSLATFAVGVCLLRGAPFLFRVPKETEV